MCRPKANSKSSPYRSVVVIKSGENYLTPEVRYLAKRITKNSVNYRKTMNGRKYSVNLPPLASSVPSPMELDFRVSVRRSNTMYQSGKNLNKNRVMGQSFIGDHRDHTL